MGHTPRAKRTRRKRKNISSPTHDSPKISDLTSKMQRLTTAEKAAPTRRKQVKAIRPINLLSSSDEGEQEQKALSDDQAMDEDADEHNPIADYWHIWSKANPKTSNAALADLDLPSQDEMRKLIDKRAKRFAKAQTALLDSYRAEWSKWVFYLHNGFNLLLTGVGSKKAFLEEFALKNLNYGGLIVVHGFYRQMTVQRVLNSITQHLMGGSGVTGGRDVFSHVANICAAMSWTKPPLEHIYIMVHNIERMPSSEAQGVLAKLAAHPRIHVIASIDHLNSTFLWDDRLLTLFSWKNWTIPTYEPYTEEVKEQPELNPMECTGEMDEERRAKGTKHVLDSLTPNHVEVIKVLGEMLQEKDGLTFQAWYNECADQLLISTDVQFRQYLEELRDHQLVLTKRSTEGVGEVYYIPPSVLNNIELDI